MELEPTRKVFPLQPPSIPGGCLIDNSGLFGGWAVSEQFFFSQSTPPKSILFFPTCTGSKHENNC
jgi:hypothetical protein